MGLLACHYNGPGEQPVRVNVAALRRKPGAALRVSGEVEVGAVRHEGSEVRFAAPLRVEAELANARLGLLARGGARGVAEFTCDRCLAPFTREVVFSFLEEYRFAEADGGEAHVLEGEEVDLAEPVREHLLLALPVKKLCRPDCRGLCPVCGQNLNAGDCGCERERVDPRLARLEDLLRDARGKG